MERIKFWHVFVVYVAYIMINLRMMNNDWTYPSSDEKLLSQALGVVAVLLGIIYLISHRKPSDKA